MINSQTGAVSYPVDYYTLGHFSKFVLPGSAAVWSSNAPGLISAAFVTPNRTQVLVAYNDSTTDQTFQVSWRQRSFSYTLPALAGATFTWSEGRDRTTGAKPGQGRAPRYVIDAAQQIQASSYTGIANLQSEPCSDADGGFDIGYGGGRRRGVVRKNQFFWRP